jgi:hypothetical protein
MGARRGLEAGVIIRVSMQAGKYGNKFGMWVNTCRVVGRLGHEILFGG